MLRQMALFALVTLAASAPVPTGSFTDAVTLSPEEWSASTASASAEPTVTSMQSQMDKQDSGLEAQPEIETLKGKQADLGAQLSELMREKEIDVRSARQLTSDEPTASIHQLTRDSTTSDSLSKPRTEEILHAASWGAVWDWSKKEASDVERYIHDVVDPDAMHSPPPPSAPAGHTFFEDDPGTGDTLRPNQVLMPGDQLRAVAHAPLGLPDLPVSEWMTKLPFLSSTTSITFVAEFGFDQVFRFFAEKSNNESILLAEADTIELTTTDPNMTDAVWTHKAKPSYYDVKRLVGLTGLPTYWAANGQTQQTRPMNGHSQFLDLRDDVNAATMLPCGTFVFHTEGEDGPPSAAALTERLANKWIFNESTYVKWALYNAFINTTRIPVSLPYWAFQNITSLGCTLAKFIMLQRVNELQFPRQHGEDTQWMKSVPWTWFGPRVENAEWLQQCQLGIEEPCGYFTPLNETYQRAGGQCIFAREGCPCNTAVFTGTDYAGRQIAPSQCSSGAPYCEKSSNPQVNRGFGLLCSSTESEEYKEDHSVWHYLWNEDIKPLANLALITASITFPGGEAVAAGVIVDDMESTGEVANIFDSSEDSISGDGSADASNDGDPNDEDANDEDANDDAPPQEDNEGFSSQSASPQPDLAYANLDLAEGSVEGSADGSAEDSADGPAEDSADGSAEDSADGPAEDSADGSAEDSADDSEADIDQVISEMDQVMFHDKPPTQDQPYAEFKPPLYGMTKREFINAINQKDPQLIKDWVAQIMAKPTGTGQSIASFLPDAWNYATVDQRLALLRAGGGDSAVFKFSGYTGNAQSNMRQLSRTIDAIFGIK